MQRNKTTLHGVITKIIDYQDYDQIFTIYSDLGVKTLIAKGSKKILSKNSRALQVGNFVEAEYFPARLNFQISKLKTATLVYQFDLYNYNLINFLAKIWKMLMLLDNKKMFTAIKTICQNYYDKHDIEKQIWLYNKFLNAFGYQQKYRGCLVCNSRARICYFDLDMGGLFCNRHTKNRYPVAIVKEYVKLNFFDYNDYKSIANHQVLKQLIEIYDNFFKTHILLS